MSRKKDNPIQYKKAPRIKNKTVRIGAADYLFITCTFLSIEGEEVAGLCDSIGKRVYVNQTSKVSDVETLIHEMAHAAFYEYGVIQHQAWCRHLEEVVAEVVSKIVAANFRLTLKK